MAPITEEDVYHALSYHKGKSPRKIRAEIGGNIVTIYSHLTSLEAQGFARHEEMEISQRRLARGGDPEYEYFLTEGGIQNRHKYEPDEDIDTGGLEPAMSVIRDSID